MVKNQGNIRIRFYLEKLKDPNIVEFFPATLGGQFAPLLTLENQDTELDALINCFNTAMTETANGILGKHRPAKKPWVTDNILKPFDKWRELTQKKNTTEGAKLWTHSLIVTLSKKGNLQLCQNYRTISLISHPSKVMLRILLDRLKPQPEEITKEETGRLQSRKGHN